MADRLPVSGYAQRDVGAVRPRALCCALICPVQLLDALSKRVPGVVVRGDATVPGLVVARRDVPLITAMVSREWSRGAVTVDDGQAPRRAGRQSVAVSDVGDRSGVTHNADQYGVGNPHHRASGRPQGYAGRETFQQYGRATCCQHLPSLHAATVRVRIQPRKNQSARCGLRMGNMLAAKLNEGSLIIGRECQE